MVATDAGLLIWGGNAEASINRREPGYEEQWNGVVVGAKTGQPRDLPDPPLCEHGQSQAVWTGEQLVMWNQEQLSLPDGCLRAATFSPRTGEWQVIEAGGFFESVGDSPVVWSGQEILAWQQGLAFDPATESVREFPPMPEYSSFTGQDMSSPPTAHWAGDRILILGSRNVIEYDPSTRRWSEGPRPPIDATALSSVWTGTHLLAVNYSMEAALYDPASRRWEEIDEIPLRFYEGGLIPVASGGIAFALASAGIAAWDGSGDWTLFPLPSPLFQPGAGEFIATGGALYHVGETLFRYVLPARQADGTLPFPDFFPVRAHYLDVPDGWDVIRSDGTTYSSPNNTDLAVDVSGPEGQECRLGGHHGLLSSRDGDSGRVRRVRDGNTVEVVEKAETGGEPARVFLPHPYSTKDTVVVTCPTLADARMLAAHLWTPFPDQ